MFILSFRFQEYDQECIYIHFSLEISAIMDLS